MTPGRTHRLLVTGSRDWDHLDSIDRVLAHYAYMASLASPGGRLVVVHGAASGGADALAARWVAQRARNGWPVEQERHPADWGAACVQECRPDHRQRRQDGSDFCPFAGFRRNQRMVDTRPLVVFGFWRNGSSGTRDCLKRAERARIPVFRATWQERELVSPDWLAARAPVLVPA